MENDNTKYFSFLKWSKSGFVAPVIYISAFLIIFGVLIWAIYHRAGKEQLDDTKILIERVVKNIEIRLKGNLDFLILIARERSEGNITEQTFQSHVSHYLIDHPEIINITWVDSDFVIKTVSPLKGNSHIIGFHLELPEPKRASNLAKTTKKSVYTRPFEAIQGKSSFEVWVPVYKGQKFLGFMAGVYSCSNLLKQSIPINKKNKTNFILIDQNNEIITDISEVNLSAKNLSYEAPLTFLGNGMKMKVEIQKSQPFTMTMNLLVLFCIILLLGFSFSLLKIKRVNQELFAAKERAEFSEANLRKRNEELRQTVQQLTDLENRLQFALLAGKLGTWDWDIQTGTIIWSDTSKIMSGIPLDADIDYNVFISTVIAEDRGKINNLVSTALKEKSDYISEYRVKWPDESIHWLRVMGRGIYNDQGEPIRMIGVGMEITESKNAALILEHSHKLMSYIIQHNPSSIAVFDKDLMYIYVSESYLRYFKTDEPDIIGKYHYDVYTDIPQKYKDAHQKSLKGEIQGEDEDPYYREDGSVIWTRWESRPWFEADGTIGGIILYTEEITERIQQKLELIAAKEKAEESDRLKTAFLQNMSHEIRTPMNAIMGFSSLMKDHFNDKSKLEKFSDIINQRGNDLLDIINDILDIAKIESGQLPINLEGCNLFNLFEDLTVFFTEYKNRIGKQHIKFSLLVDCNKNEANIITDKGKLKQILINLITNAFKFTDVGKVEGRCKFDEAHNLIFYVSDTGIGIPKEKQNVIFERFSQLNQNPQKNIGGTGLGLPIVKGLVNLLGGEIFLESEPNKGSTFSFTISYKVNKEISSLNPSEITIDMKNAGEKIILIVEDDMYNAEYLKEILSGSQLKILYAKTGEEAIKMAQTHEVKLILMDVRLPGMDGYEATRQILSQKPHLKIIAQTAYASTDEKQKAINAGCKDYISKPTKKETLLFVINRVLDKA